MPKAAKRRLMPMIRTLWTHRFFSKRSFGCYKDRFSCGVSRPDGVALFSAAHPKMKFKSLLLVVMTVTLLAAMAFWTVGMFKKDNAEQAGEDPGNIFMECPECHLKLRVSLETAKKG